MIKKIALTTIYILSVILGALFLVAITTFVLWPILQSSTIAPGSDIGSHIYVAKYIADYFKQFGKLPHIIPYWYANWEVLHNSPPLTPILMGIMAYFIDSFEKLSHYTDLVIMSFLVLVAYFSFLRRFWWPIAILGAILFAFSRPILHDFPLVGGAYHRILALAALPPAFIFFNNILEEKRPYLNIFFLTLALAFAIFAHLLIASLIILTLGIYGLIRELLDRKIRGIGLIFASLALILTITAAAFYIIPLLIEKTGWTKLPDYIPGSFYSWNLIIRVLIPETIASILLFLLFKREKTPAEMALFYTIIFAFSISFGVESPVYRLFQFANIYPFSGVFFVNFGAVYLALTTLGAKKSFSWKKIILFLFMIGVAIYEIYFGFTNAKLQVKSIENRYKPATAQGILTKINQLGARGRMMPMHYPFPDFIIWWAPIYKIQMVEGWYYSATIQGKHIAWIYDAIYYGYPEYAVRRLKQLNVKFFVTNPNFFQAVNTDRFLEFLALLKQNNFTEIEYQTQRKITQSIKLKYQLLFDNSPSSYFQPLEQKVLAIGQGASNANSIIPDTIQGNSVFIDDYDERIFSYFQSLILVGFKYHNREKAEELIKNFIRQGGKVIIDFNQAEGSHLEDVPTFLGVSGQRQIAYGNVITIVIPNNLVPKELLPTVFEKPAEIDTSNIFRYSSQKSPARIPLKEWRYIEYLNLDSNLVSRDGDDNSGLYGLIGYKMVEGKPVWFIGPNFFYHAFLTHNQRELDLLNYLISSQTGHQNSEISKNGQHKTPQAQINVITDDLEYKKISYASEDPLPLLVSYTYSPHWQAYLDGKEIKIYNLEDLMFLSLPAGDGEIELKYEETRSHIWGRTITGLTVLILFVLVYVDFRQRKKGGKNKAEIQDSHP